PNPYEAGKPIRRKNSKVFFGREDVFKEIAQILDENTNDTSGKSRVLLVGERRMGKTSVLLQLDYELPERYIPVFMDMQGFNDSGDAAFLYWFGIQIRRSLEKMSVQIEIPSLEKLQAAPTTLFSEFLYSDLPAALARRHVVLLFDEFEHM